MEANLAVGFDMKGWFKTELIETKQINSFSVSGGIPSCVLNNKSFWYEDNSEHTHYSTLIHPLTWIISNNRIQEIKHINHASCTHNIGDIISCYMAFGNILNFTKDIDESTVPDNKTS